MIRHFVHLRFRDAVSDGEKLELFAALSGLSDHLGGVLDFQHRKNVSPEAPVVRGFLDMFWFDFETAAARDAYLADAEHKAVGARLVAAAEGGIDGIFVCDVEV